MMNLISTTKIKDIEESTLFDTCTIDIFTSASTTHADITKTYSSGSTIKCGVTNNSGNKSYSSDGGVTTYSYDYVVRLSLDETIKSTDRITIKTKNGNAVNQVVDIINLQVGTGCLILKCKLAEV